MKIEEIITDQELDEALGNADFGDISKRDALKQMLISVIGGYKVGPTARDIVIKLYLVYPEFSKKWCLTEKGVKYLKAILHTEGAMNELAKMFDEKPIDMVMFMLIQIGKLCVEANAETMDLSQESDIKGHRYKISCKITVKQL